MRLAEGIVVDVEETFGQLKFSALRRDVYERDAEGNQTAAIKERTYDLKSRGAGMMIQVSVPGNVALKEYAYDTEVVLVNPVLDTVATPNYRGADINWYVKADDFIPKGAATTASGDNKKPEGMTKPDKKPEQK